MDSPEPAPVPAPVSSRRPRGVGLWRLLLTVSLFLTLCLASFLAFPELMVRWQYREARARADAAYLKRQAELRAEYESADARLAELDRRVHFVSLGFRDVARKVAPVVVNVTNEEEVPLSEGRRLFFDLKNKRSYHTKAEGSGLLVRKGLVLTNDHVVKGAHRLRVTFANDQWVTVKPDAVSSDPLTDLAVIRLPEDARAAAGQDYDVMAEFADSDRDVLVGDWVLAAGSPFGLKQTLTAGIISAKGRVELGILDQVELLQTDAPINPGNSGGPLFDQRGRVVGINVAIASRSGANQGVGFAIPSNTAREVLAQLADHGEVVRGFLGVIMQDLPLDLEARLGINETGGVLVSGVGPGTPADQAGLHTGDVIIRFQGEPVGSTNAVNQLRQRIARTEPGTGVTLEVLRRGRHLDVEVTIVKRPSQP